MVHPITQNQLFNGNIYFFCNFFKTTELYHGLIKCIFK